MEDWKDIFPQDSIYYQSENGILYYGDCSLLMKDFADESIDMILTDPPYTRKFLYTYKYLAMQCPRIMKNGASLLTIVGHYALPDVIGCFNNRLKYRWVFCLNQEVGKHPRMAMGIEVLWKPILWYVKKAFPTGKGFIKDMIKVSKDDGIRKQFHKWQQSTQWAEFFIKKLSDVEDIIFDPFIGSGTVAIVSEKLKRRWIGIEIDESFCNICAERLETEVK